MRDQAARSLLRPFLAGAPAKCTTCSYGASRSLPSIPRPQAATTSRAFFSLPDLSKLGSSSGQNGSSGGKHEDAQTFHEMKDFKYSPEELYEIVADVDSYSSFLPNCLESRVIGPADPPHPTLTPRTVRLHAAEAQVVRQTGQAVRADLTVGFNTFRESYTSRVEMVPGRYVTATADTDSNPLFKHLYTEWSFHTAASSSSSSSSSSSVPLSLFNHSSSSSTSTPSPSSSSAPPGPSHATRLEFTLEYAFRNPLYGMVASKAFNIMAGRMMHAFEERAIRLYGRR